MKKQQHELQELRLQGLLSLQKLLASSREQLRSIRFRVAGSQYKDVREVRELRHRIARILTVLNQASTKQTAKSEQQEKI